MPALVAVQPETKRLQLKVLSSTSLERGLIILIDQTGLVCQDRKSRDGVTYFGYSATVDNTGCSSIEDDGATGGPNNRNYIDFIIPHKPTDDQKH